MKFKFTFPKELKETMQEAFKIEHQSFKNSLQTKKWKLLNYMYKKAFGIDFILNFNYQFISDTEAIVEIISSSESFVKPEKILEILKEYSKADNRIKIEMIK